ncbi:MAG: putative flippase GtrA [Polaribacter sp.]|jgi:putative flippase GtrA
MSWLAKLFKKDLSTFIRFSVVGAVWTIINIGSDILLIDHYELPGWLGALIGYVVLYIGRYYSYLLLKVIEPQFLKYVYSTMAFTLVMWVLKTISIDFLDLTAALVSPVIAASGFILKYFFYKSINLLKSEEKPE